MTGGQGQEDRDWLGESKGQKEASVAEALSVRGGGRQIKSASQAEVRASRVRVWIQR